MNRRGFLGLLGAAAGALVVPELLLPKRTFFLPPAGGWIPKYEHIRYALGYKVTRAELEDNLYGFGLAHVKQEGSAIWYDELLPGVKLVWDRHFDTAELVYKDLYDT